MIRLSQLRTLKSLSTDALTKELGPFVLVHRPLRVAPPKISSRTLIIPRGGAAAITPTILDSDEELAVLTAVTRGGRAEYAIGRSPLCDVVISEPSVSSRHAVMSVSMGRWRLADAGSRNGTRINELPVFQVALPLTEQDVLSFADVSYVFVTTAGLRALLDRRPVP
jgi:pSer/pThr/pTyr-binding forkhead associated (FHA) protein